jgi:hypothetical protein
VLEIVLDVLRAAIDGLLVVSIMNGFTETAMNVIQCKACYGCRGFKIGLLKVCLVWVIMTFWRILFFRGNRRDEYSGKLTDFTS